MEGEHENKSERLGVGARKGMTANKQNTRDIIPAVLLRLLVH